MKVKLTKPNVINGAVWNKDAIVNVSDEEGKRLIAKGEAVEVRDIPKAAPQKDAEK